MNKFKQLILMSSFICVGHYAYAQEEKPEQFILSLEEIITLACDSSIDAFIAENNLLVEYWYYKNYKAGKLPFLDLNSTVVDFNRAVVKEYNFADSTYQYVDQQTINSYLNLSLNQNISKTGGKIFIDSDLGRLQNLNTNTPVQYSSTLIRLGISQQLFGYNSFKWDDKIMPLKYEKAKMQFIVSIQDIAIKSIDYFFNLAIARQDYDIAQSNLENAKNLFEIGQKRFNIGSVSLEDLITMEIDLINAKNNIKITKQNLDRVELSLHSFLRIDENVGFDLELPKIDSGLLVDPLQALAYAAMYNPQSLNNQVSLLLAKSESERAKMEKRFKANLNASFGLNQTGNNLGQSYQEPKDQEMVYLGVKIPIIDWGLAKSYYQVALQQEKITEFSVEQSAIDFKQLVIAMVNEFNVQYDLVTGAKKAKELAEKSYQINIESFKTGKIDLVKLNMALNYHVSAQNKYIGALESYYYTLYKVKQLTLFDFERNVSLSAEFENLLEIK